MAITERTRWQAIGLPWPEQTQSAIATVGAGALESAYTETGLQLYTAPDSGNSKAGGTPTAELTATGSPTTALDWDARVQGAGHINGAGSLAYRKSSSGNWVGQDAPWCVSWWEPVDTNSGTSSPCFMGPDGDAEVVVVYSNDVAPVGTPDSVDVATRAEGVGWGTVRSIITLGYEIVTTTPMRVPSPAGVYRESHKDYTVAIIDHVTSDGGTTYSAWLSFYRTSDVSASGSTPVAERAYRLDSDTTGTDWDSLCLAWDDVLGNWHIFVRDTTSGTVTIHQLISADDFGTVESIDTIAPGSTTKMGVAAYGGKVVMALKSSAGVIRLYEGASSGVAVSARSIAWGSDSAIYPIAGTPSTASSGLTISGYTLGEDVAVTIDPRGRLYIAFLANEGTKVAWSDDWRTFKGGGLSYPGNHATYNSYQEIRSIFPFAGGLIVGGDPVPNTGTVNGFGAFIAGHRRMITDDVNYDARMTFEPIDLMDKRGWTRSGTFTITEAITSLKDRFTVALTQSGYYAAGTFGGTPTSYRGRFVFTGSGGSVTEDAWVIESKMYDTGAANSYILKVRFDFANDQIRVLDNAGTLATATSVGLNTGSGVVVLIEHDADNAHISYSARDSEEYQIIHETATPLTAVAAAAAYVHVGAKVGTPTQTSTVDVEWIGLGTPRENGTALSDGFDDETMLTGIPATAYPMGVGSSAFLQASGGPLQKGDQWQVNTRAPRGFHRAIDSVNYPSPRDNWVSGSVAAGTDWHYVLDLGAGWDSLQMGDLLGVVITGAKNIDALSVYISADGATFPGSPAITKSLGETLSGGWTRPGGATGVGFLGTSTGSISRYLPMDFGAGLVAKITDNALYDVWQTGEASSGGQWGNVTGQHRASMRFDPSTPHSGVWGTLAASASVGTITVYHDSILILIDAKTTRINRYLKFVGSAHLWATSHEVGMVSPLRVHLFPKQFDEGSQETISLTEDVAVYNGVRYGRALAPPVGVIRLPVRQEFGIGRGDKTTTTALGAVGYSTAAYTTYGAGWETLKWAINAAGSTTPIVLAHSIEAPSGFSSSVGYLGRDEWMLGTLEPASKTVQRGRPHEAGYDNVYGYDYIVREVP